MEPPEASGDVVAHEVSTAPGKEREREPLYSGDIANLGPGQDITRPTEADAGEEGGKDTKEDGMDVDEGESAIITHPPVAKSRTDAEQTPRRRARTHLPATCTRSRRRTSRRRRTR